MVAACCQTYQTVCQAKSMGGWDASWPQGPKGLPTLAPPSMLGSGVGRGLGGGSPPVAVGPAPSVALGVGIRPPPQHQHPHQHQRVHRIASLHPRRGERTGRTGHSSPGALMGAWGGLMMELLLALDGGISLMSRARPPGLGPSTQSRRPWTADGWHAQASQPVLFCRWLEALSCPGRCAGARAALAKAGPCTPGPGRPRP